VRVWEFVIGHWSFVIGIADFELSCQ